MNYIKGVFEKTIYASDDGFIVGNFKIEETNDEEMQNFVGRRIIFTGLFAFLNEKEHYVLYGNLNEHPKYGYQYQVKSYEQIKPQDIDGIKLFLCSDLFKGIGEKIAASIVDTLGEDALNKIIENRSSLDLVPKLSLKKANEIYNTLVKYEESHKTIIYLTNLGFTMQDALVIYNLYKENTIFKLEHNIYDILDDTDISFIKVDEVALKNNIFEEINRVKACIIYVIKKLTFELGNTYLTFEEIKRSTFNYLKYEFSDELFFDYLNELFLEEKIVIEGDKYFDLEIYNSENYITQKMVKVLSFPKKKYKSIDNTIKKLEETNNITYDEKQKEAIKNSLQNRITVITGGPGTGKTTIIKAIVSLYKTLNKLDNDKIDYHVALLAPTGRASKRLAEATNISASTIHRYLKWNKEANEFGVNEYNKNFHKLIIIDESSMLDTNLLASLFKGILDDIQIIFVGDHHQLPSVGAGQILKDIIDSGVIDVISLELLYRQSVNSYIPYLAEEIKNGEVGNFLEKSDDYQFLSCNQNSIKDNLNELCKKIIEKGYDYKNFQIMVPTYLGINGIDALNNYLQNTFNPKDDNKKEYVYGDIIYRENDKILQLVNMPDDNVFNGDVGVISEIIPATISSSKKVEIYINYDGNIVKYLPKDLNKIKHGFVISIHKAQGSEFEMVVIPVCMNYSRMLYRKLIYTAVTRAKRKLIIIGEPNAFVRSIQNNFDQKRRTMLKEKLITFLHK